MYNAIVPYMSWAAVAGADDAFAVCSKATEPKQNDARSHWSIQDGPFETALQVVVNHDRDGHFHKFMLGTDQLYSSTVVCGEPWLAG